ncbi:MAG: hypothetical protein ABUS57_05255 [Pseudomonadota bacterium]
MSKAKDRNNPERAARKLRRTVASSGLTGVLAMAVGGVMSVDGGFNGLVGTSVAHNLTRHEDELRDRGFADAAPQLTGAELHAIDADLEQGAAALDAARASTDVEIERMKTLTGGHGSPRTVEGAYTAATFGYNDAIAMLLAVTHD